MTAWPARQLAISLAIGAAIAILLLAPLPAPTISPGWTFALPLDKVVHFVLFLLAARPWRRSVAALDFARPGLVTLAFAAAYAGLLELAQGALTVTRMPDWGDFLAGAAGAAIGALLAGRGDRRQPLRLPET